MTIKQSGSSCPSCGATPCAEYALKDMPPRWKCHGCGAGGDLAGEFMERGTVAPAVKKQPRIGGLAP